MIGSMYHQCCTNVVMAQGEVGSLIFSICQFSLVKYFPTMAYFELTATGYQLQNS